MWQRLWHDLRHEGAWLPLLALLTLLLLLMQFNADGFPIIADLILALLALQLSVVVWYSSGVARNRFLVLLAAGSFWVGVWYLLHVVAELEIAPVVAAATTYHYGLAARLLEALMLFAAAWMVGVPTSPWFCRQRWFLLFAAATLLLWFAIGHGYWPFQGGAVTTMWVAESLLLLLLLLALWQLWQRRDWFEHSMLPLLLLAYGTTALVQLLLLLLLLEQPVIPPPLLLLKVGASAILTLTLIRHSLVLPFRTLTRGLHSYDAVPVPTLLLDQQGVIRHCNGAAMRLAGATEDQLIGVPVHRLFHDAAISSHDCPVCRAITDGELPKVLELSLPARQQCRQITLTPLTASGIPGAVLEVSHDITETRQAQEALLRYRNELEQRVAERTRELQHTNQELESFSYSVAHDMRSPLRAINGFASVLLEDCGEHLDPIAIRHLERIRCATLRMNGLIDSMLQLSQVMQNEPQWQSVDLAALATETLAELQAAEPHRRVELALTGDLQTYGDPDLLRLLLDNLIGNAWKFTYHQPLAQIRLQRAAGDGFCLCDNGVGFDPCYQEKLFRAFSRLHTEQEFHGNGIGLATVRRIVQQHRGSVWAEGTPGRGACFCFTLDNRHDAVGESLDEGSHPAAS